ncbi:hypothetical protein HK096_005853, partial [Nowakowskiella sp. JEL0078]
MMTYEISGAEGERADLEIMKEMQEIYNTEKLVAAAEIVSHLDMAFARLMNVEEFKNDKIYLDLWLEYIATKRILDVPNSEISSIYKSLDNQHIGQLNAKFYLSWSEFEESIGSYDRAQRIILSGCNNNAIPENTLTARKNLLRQKYYKSVVTTSPPNSIQEYSAPNTSQISNNILFSTQLSTENYPTTKSDNNYQNSISTVKSQIFSHKDVVESINFEGLNISSINQQLHKNSNPDFEKVKNSSIEKQIHLRKNSVPELESLKITTINQQMHTFKNSLPNMESGILKVQEFSHSEDLELKKYSNLSSSQDPTLKRPLEQNAIPRKLPREGHDAIDLNKSDTEKSSLINREESKLGLTTKNLTEDKSEENKQFLTLTTLGRSQIRPVQSSDDMNLDDTFNHISKLPNSAATTPYLSHNILTPSLKSNNPSSPLISDPNFAEKKLEPLMTTTEESPNLRLLVNEPPKNQVLEQLQSSHLVPGELPAKLKSNSKPLESNHPPSVVTRSTPSTNIRSVISPPLEKEKFVKNKNPTSISETNQIPIGESVQKKDFVTPVSILKPTKLVRADSDGKITSEQKNDQVDDFQRQERPKGYFV